MRGQVEKRIRRRIAALGLSGFSEYRARLEVDAEEWGVLDQLCRVTISRFNRDQRVWDTLREEVLTTLASDAIAAGEPRLRCWSLGCASGEEPCTLSILWTLALAELHPNLSLEILATDVDAEVLDRARVAVYDPGSLRELPQRSLEEAFEPNETAYRLRERFRAPVEFKKADARDALPAGRVPSSPLQEPRLHLLRRAPSAGDARSSRDEPRPRRRVRRGPSQLPPGAPLEPWFPKLGIWRRP